jgi:hypothetical protein
LCNFNTFIGPNTEAGSLPAVCGFNKNNQAYCPLQMGDLLSPNGLNLSMKFSTMLNVTNARTQCGTQSSGFNVL